MVLMFSVLGEIMRQGSLLDAPPDFQVTSRNKARVISNDATIAEVHLSSALLIFSFLIFRIRYMLLDTVT